MTPKEIENLKRASEAIKAKKYQMALAILESMPDSAKAQEWAIKVNEKIMFDATPPSDTGDMPLKPVPYKKRFNWRKWALVAVLALMFAGIGIYLAMDNFYYETGMKNLAEAKLILEAECNLFWGDKYTPQECVMYAEIYMNANIRQALSIVVCDRVNRWEICPVKDPDEVLGY